MATVAAPRFLEVEIGTFCNRACAWCPNGWHDRGQQVKAMAPATWRALLDDLSSWGYRGVFAFHNYNEPMADPALPARIAEARAALPDATLDVHTNGDFLTPASLEGLRAAGLDALQVTLYPSNARAMEPPEEGRAQRFIARLGVAAAQVTVKPSKLTVEARLEGLHLVVRVPRIAAYHHRAGAVRFAPLASAAVRERPCFMPFTSAAVDVHGALKVCCHIYDTTTPDAAPYVVGHVGRTPFRRLWAGRRMEALRRRLAAADFEGLTKCLACTHQQPAKDEQLGRARARRLE